MNACSLRGPGAVVTLLQREGGTGRGFAEPLSGCGPPFPGVAPWFFDGSPPAVPLPCGLELCVRARVCAALPTSFPPSAPLMSGCLGRDAAPAFGAEDSAGTDVPFGLPVDCAHALVAARRKASRATAARAVGGREGG